MNVYVLLKDFVSSTLDSNLEGVFTNKKIAKEHLEKDIEIHQKIGWEIKSVVKEGNTRYIEIEKVTENHIFKARLRLIKIKTTKYGIDLPY